MKKLSLPLLSDTVISRRKGLKMTQAELASRAGMNRSMLSRLETGEYTPSIVQLQALAEILCFEPTDFFIDSDTQMNHRAMSPIGQAENGAVDSTGSQTEGLSPLESPPLQDRRRRNRLRRPFPRCFAVPAQRRHRGGHPSGKGGKAQQL